MLKCFGLIAGNNFFSQTVNPFEDAGVERFQFDSSRLPALQCFPSVLNLNHEIDLIWKSTICQEVE
ncbi:hypothetical protein Dbac_2594 [Desulfomicrobium baculatum DSM 4028]|uniref:Uncharacterized protein n=1 Tax=Desulfomicrobium baculatum (strain DSM 4028 / VKM B-1378 / X) TaxID=525897 RepID=C7LSC3_DESBD|nr:hypothetical protein Dbac_2594 [Desulfomicrobium baculatum DSM 4028]